MKRSIILTIFIFCLISISYAEVPHLINYQGRLTNKAGKPLEGTHNITFRIYDVETGQGEMSPWEEVHSGINIQGSIFSVILGSITPLNLPFDKPYFLEIQVGDEVMSPRQQLTSVGYAIRAEQANYAINADAVDGKEASDFIEKGSTAGGDLSGTYPNPTTVTAIPKNIQVFTSSGTWIKPPRINTVYVKVWGGGGGGGGSRGSNSGEYLCGGGGGGGGYSEGLITVSRDVSVTIGLGGGSGSSWGFGGTGGTSSFAGDTTIQATGGSGGGGFGKGRVDGIGGIGEGGDMDLTGAPGTAGAGGSSPFGGTGGAKVTDSVGRRGRVPGGGGSGGRAYNYYDRNGGDGAPGMVIVYY